MCPLIYSKCACFMVKANNTVYPSRCITNVGNWNKVKIQRISGNGRTTTLADPVRQDAEQEPTGMYLRRVCVVVGRVVWRLLAFRQLPYFGMKLIYLKQINIQKYLKYAPKPHAKSPLNPLLFAVSAVAETKLRLRCIATSGN